MTRRAGVQAVLVGALALGAALAGPAGASAAKPKVTLKVLSATQKDLLSAGKLSVRVKATGRTSVWEPVRTNDSA